MELVECRFLDFAAEGAFVNCMSSGRVQKCWQWCCKRSRVSVARLTLLGQLGFVLDALVVAHCQTAVLGTFIRDSAFKQTQVLSVCPSPPPTTHTHTTCNDFSRLVPFTSRSRRQQVASTQNLNVP